MSKGKVLDRPRGTERWYYHKSQSRESGRSSHLQASLTVWDCRRILCDISSERLQQEADVLRNPDPSVISESDPRSLAIYIVFRLRRGDRFS